MNVTKISVIIPAYNEAESIGEVLSELAKLDTALPVPFETIVVDDASTDGTGKVVATFPHIQYIRHARNGGKGTALRTGLQAASGDVIVIQDADMEYHPVDIPNLLSPIIHGDADVVFGSRFMGQCDSMSFSHRMGNKILNVATNLLYDTHLTDVMTGYKLFSRAVLDTIELTEESFSIEIELVSKCLRNGWRIVEVPISYCYRKHGTSKIAYRHGVNSLYKLFVNRIA
jgi:glycosyltransferase involved in cell wall biosynthesis